MGIPFLGAVPLDPRIGVACDYGESFFDAYPESPACDALLEIIRTLREEMGVTDDTSGSSDMSDN
jgi:hypothetical protein